jgi:Flp pilus assembly protein TadG
MSPRTAGAATGERGVVTVEFAIILPLALGVVFLVVVASSAALWGTLCEYKARDLARYVSVLAPNNTVFSYPDQIGSQQTGACKSTPTVCTRAGSILLGKPSSLVVTSTGASGVPHEGDLVTVSVSYKNPIAAGLGGLTGALGLNTGFWATANSTATARRG